jgi:hypothetical protein
MMPRKSVLKDTQSTFSPPLMQRKIQKDDEWGGYVLCNVGDIEKESYSLWYEANQQYIMGYLSDIAATGLKCTLVYDASNQCFIASLTGRPDYDGQVPYTATLSARGATLHESLAVLLYKHIEMTGADWTEWLINGAKTKRQFG